MKPHLKILTLAVSVLTKRINIKKFYVMFALRVRIWEQTADLAVYVINWFIVRAVVESV